MTATLSPEQAKKVASLWLDAESHRAAELVLEHIDDPHHFPRDLAQIIPLHFKVQVKPIPGLSVNLANNWFLARGSVRAFAGEDRPLHGCCFNDKGHGIIFIDANDTSSEKRFTLAHELSHYLLDYHLPRKAAIVHFGDGILDVLDGKRQATIGERFKSVYTHLPLGPSTDLMERARDPSAAYEISNVEARTDRLALALLAPADIALADLRNAPYGEQLAILSARLHEAFGLPAQVGERYADALLLALGRAPSRFGQQGVQ